MPLGCCVLAAGEVHVPRVRARRHRGADAAVRRLRRLVPHVLPAAAAARRAQGGLALPRVHRRGGTAAAMSCAFYMILSDESNKSV